MASAAPLTDSSRTGGGGDTHVSGARPTGEGRARPRAGETDAAGGAQKHPRLTLWQRFSGTDEDPEMEDWRRPSPGWRGLRVDVPIAVVFTAMMVLAERFNSQLIFADEGVTSPTWSLFVIPACIFVAMSLRRLFPIPAAILGTLTFLVGQQAPYLDQLFTQVACFLFLFSATAWSPHRRGVMALNITVLVVFLSFGVVTSVNFTMLGADQFADVFVSFAFGFLINLLYVVVAAVFGANEYRRARNETALARRTVELRERTTALEAEREIVAEQAVRLDRVEIARELHDVVAHHVSLMGLQAAAARRSIDSAPDKIEPSLLAVEESARTAITELQLMLSTLRSSSGSSETHERAAESVAAPSTVSIEQVPALIESVRGAGLDIEYHVVGDERPVTGVVGLTAYRILQEALTNVQKHVGVGAEVDARLRYLGDSLEVDVTNGPRVPGQHVPEAASGGRGLLGMRERAIAVGGTFDAGPRAAGGFRVVARLPYGSP